MLVVTQSAEEVGTWQKRDSAIEQKAFDGQYIDRIDQSLLNPSMEIAEREWVHGAPPLVQARAISNPIERNNQFNQWYHGVDMLMQRYMGTPTVPSWATFGKHASFSAGKQLVEILDADQFAEAAQALLADLSDGIGLNKNEIAVFMGEVRNIATSIDAFLLHPGLIGNMLRMVRARAKRATYTPDTTTLDDSLDHVRTALVEGNTRIYEFMAPNFIHFLDTAQKSSDGIPKNIQLDGDEQGHLGHAFQSYADARELYLASGNGIEQRMQLAFRGNLSAVFNEQLNRVQPLYDPIKDELRSMRQTLHIQTPAGSFALLPNHTKGTWANLYDRMGIDPQRAPKDPKKIESKDLESLLLPADDPRFQGTIAHFFFSAVGHPTYLARLFEQPKIVARHNLW